MSVFLGLGYLAQDDFFSCSIHLPASFMMSSLLILQCVNASYFLVQTLVEEHLGCFQYLTVMSKPTVSIVQQVSMRYDGGSFGHRPKSAITNLEVD